MQYFRADHDEAVMNRDRLLTKAISMIGKMQDQYRPPEVPTSELANATMADKMASFMQDGIDRGDFMPHDKTVAMAIASVMLQRAGDGGKIDEQGLYEREREAFISLAKTKETYIRIASMLDHGAPVRN
jgi:3-hydroxyacyl-CoA dehydrogenase